MARPVRTDERTAIEDVVRARPGGITLGQIMAALPMEIPRRTLQHHLKSLTDSGRLVRTGDRRGAKYHLPSAAPLAGEDEAVVPLSAGGRDVLAYIRQPSGRRQPVGYDREVLDSYRPNISAWLNEKERAHLLAVGTIEVGEQPAGTYAKQILDRLLIDLSWNSSRLEGNTYSLLDTRRLIDFGEQAEGKALLEAQMILNHKDAIEFLVSAAEDIGFNRYTILNLHALLASGLLPDEADRERFRELAERELIGLHEGNFARYRIRPSDFAAWQAVWTERAPGSR